MARIAGLPILLLLLPAAADAGTQDGARALLERSAQALSRVRSAEYSATHEGYGSMAARFSPFRGRVRLARERPGDPVGARLLVEGHYLTVGDGERRDFAVSYDGWTLVDLRHWERKATVGRPWETGLFGLDQGAFLLFPDLYDPDPLRGHLEAPLIRGEGRALVEGVPCDVVYVEWGPAENDVKARLFLAVEDHLPRRVQWIWATGTTGKEEGGNVHTLSDLRVNEPLGPEIFAARIPESYERGAPEVTVALEVGHQAPDWELEEAGGGRLRLSELRGQVVVLDFWATWCGPCIEAMPILEDLRQHYEDREVEFVAVHCRDEADGQALLRRKGYGFRSLLEGDPAADAFGVEGLPTLFILDAHGRVTLRKTGFGPGVRSELASAIETALAAGGSPLAP